MTLKQLSKARNVDDVRGIIQYLRDADAHYKDKKGGMYVTDTSVDNACYFMSTFRDSIVYSHFFFQERGSLVGLFRYRDTDEDLVRLTETAYKKISFVHEKVWVLMNQDTSYSLYAGDDIVADDFTAVKVVPIGDRINIGCLVSDTYTSLICCDNSNYVDGINSPSSETDFQDWFLDMVYKRGQTGELDFIPLSELLHLELSIRYNMFGSKKEYKQLMI